MCRAVKLTDSVAAAVDLILTLRPSTGSLTLVDLMLALT